MSWRGDTNNYQEFTVPDGVEKVRITAIGGGGGGGSYGSHYMGGCGGGGGAYASGEYTVEAGDIIRVTPGHGGYGDRAASGGTGGTTTVQDNASGTLGGKINISCEGGTGGHYGNSIGYGGDTVTLGGSSLQSGNQYKSAGGNGGYGAPSGIGWKLKALSLEAVVPQVLSMDSVLTVAALVAAMTVVTGTPVAAVVASAVTVVLVLLTTHLLNITPLEAVVVAVPLVLVNTAVLLDTQTMVLPTSLLPVKPDVVALVWLAVSTLMVIPTSCLKLLVIQQVQTIGLCVMVIGNLLIPVKTMELIGMAGARFGDGEAEHPEGGWDTSVHKQNRFMRTLNEDNNFTSRPVNKKRSTELKHLTVSLVAFGAAAELVVTLVTHHLQAGLVLAAKVVPVVAVAVAAVTRLTTVALTILHTSINGLFSGIPPIWRSVFMTNTVL